MELERIVGFGGRDVGFVQLDGRAREGAFGISPLALHSFNRAVSRKDYGRIVARLKMSLDIWRFFRVGGAHCIGGSFGGFECLGHCQRDVLAVIVNHIVFERRPALFADAIEARGRGRAKDLTNVPAVENCSHPRHVLGGRSVQREQLAIRDGRFYGNCIKHSGKHKVGCVLR